MIARLKYAAMVLSGYRPAEVRYDETDREIAAEIAEVLARVCVESGDFSEDSINMAICHAIREYASWEGRSETRERMRRFFAERDRQMKFHF